MDLRLLEIFCRVYRARSFSRAARELGLTQPTISVHIRDLEDTFGTPLFHRLGRQIEPTEAGGFLYEHGKALVSLKRHVSEQMAQFLNRVEGDLVVGASSVPGEYLLPGMLAGFQVRHPGVRPRLRISDTAATLEDLRQGDIELGVVGTAVADNDLVFAPLAKDTLVLVVPAARPWNRRTEVSLREMVRLPMLLREVGSGTRTVLERALGARGLTLGDCRVAAELHSTTAIKQALKEGHGISFISALAVASERAAGTLRVARVRGLGRIHRTYFTVVRRKRVLSPVVRAFLEYLTGRRDPGAGRAARGTRPAHS